MNNLDKLFDSIWKNFERFLRWVYPGGLTVVLLYAANPEFLKDHVYHVFGGWGMVIGGLVAGAVVYLFQAYVVSWIVTFTFILLKWDVSQGLQVPVKSRLPNGKAKAKPLCCRKIRFWFIEFIGWRGRRCLKSIAGVLERIVDTSPVCCLAPFARVFDRMAAATEQRWQLSNKKDYLNYAWANYHAILITGWLPIFFYLIRKDPSVLSEGPASAVLTPAILLLLGGIVYYALLTRIRID